MTVEDDRSRELLDAYRNGLTPDATEADDNWRAIEDRIAGGELPLELPEEPMSREDGDRAGVVAWIAAGVAVAAATVALSSVSAPVLSNATAEGAAPEAPYEAPAVTSVGGEAVVRHPARTPEPSPATLVPEAVEPTAPGPEPADISRRRRSEPPPTPVTPAPAATATQAAAEAALVGRARAALRDENPGTALELMSSYRQRFPDGELREEAELVQLAALCDMGREDEARSGTARFVREHPSSPLAGHARRICAAQHEAR